MPLLSLANLVVPETDPLQQIDAAAHAGFDAVGLCLNPADRPGARLVSDRALRRETKDLLRQRGLTLLDIEIFPLWPDTEVRSLLPALEAGADLGATFVLVTGNDDDEERACANFAGLCELCLPLGLRPMLEIISYRPLRDLAQARRWLARASHASGGLCIDALHLFRSGASAADLRRIDPGAIGYAQLADAVSAAPSSQFSAEQLLREARSDRRLPGEGVLPLVDLLEALPPGLPLSIEAPCEAHAELPPRERAVLAMQATRKLLSRVRSI
ncbi:sugar phosphate isomerase/epimerase family protein [Labrys neptuniae]